MMIQNKIKKENILLDLEAATKQEVIEKMSEKLYENGFINEAETFQTAVFEREAHMTTGIGNNLAIPHGKSETVQESTVAFAKLKQPVEWGSLDQKPVKFVFLLAIKAADKGEEHLRVLAELSEKLMDDEFVAQLKEASTREAIVNALVF